MLRTPHTPLSPSLRQPQPHAPEPPQRQQLQRTPASHLQPHSHPPAAPQPPAQRQPPPVVPQALPPQATVTCPLPQPVSPQPQPLRPPPPPPQQKCPLQEAAAPNCPSVRPQPPSLQQRLPQEAAALNRPCVWSQQQVPSPPQEQANYPSTCTQSHPQMLQSRPQAPQQPSPDPPRGERPRVPQDAAPSCPTVRASLAPLQLPSPSPSPLPLPLSLSVPLPCYQQHCPLQAPLPCAFTTPPSPCVAATCPSGKRFPSTPLRKEPPAKRQSVSPINAVAGASAPPSPATTRTLSQSPSPSPLPPPPPGERALGPWLQHWGLPTVVAEQYDIGDRRGRQRVTQLYDWQLECLRDRGIIDRRNLVLCTPTSSGKSLVAEIALLRCVIHTHRIAILVLPYVSLVQQQTKKLERFGRMLGVSVEPYYNSHGTLPVPPGAAQLLIATIEKASAIINDLIDHDRATELGCVVADEVHMIAEPRRGPLLELLLTKVLYVCKHNVQLIGMSATVANLPELASWLGASSYTSDVRPVRLVEHIVVGRNVFGVSDGILERTLPQPSPSDAKRVPQALVLCLCLEALNADGAEYNVLVFCPSKRSCTERALALAKLLPEPHCSARAEDREQLVQRLKAAGSLDRNLHNAIRHGIAFHNANLSADERKQVEGGFSSKVVRVLCCTSTLAAGVNLPARRVIIWDPKIGIEPLSPRYYRQMTGRAGRAGFDEEGESFLVSGDMKKAFDLALAPAQPVYSFLDAPTQEERQPEQPRDPANFENAEWQEYRRMLLECVCSGMCVTREDVRNFVSRTFMSATAVSAQQQKCKRAPDFEQLLQSLVANNFIEECDASKAGATPVPAPATAATPAVNPCRRLVPTQIGKATYHSCFLPAEAMAIHAELQHAREVGIIFADDLHMCYLTTPLSVLGGTVTTWEWVRRVLDARVFAGLLSHPKTIEVRD
eukprot:TRINITY_DN86_c0_g4_i4.p1 TRINITY_DN86_c0_g4~~TRINITY_DN86_c0_g4_i4.p1  ORF type:complete len:947 (+),score=196.48 TRINITY_DN86_c0_g4_i4:248-3088(+)